MLRPPTPFLRLNVRGHDVWALARTAKAAGWQVPRDTVEYATQFHDGTGEVGLSLDLDPERGALPTLGFEQWVANSDEVRRYLIRAAKLRLCTPDRRAFITRWTGVDTIKVRGFTAPRRVRRWVGHFKLVFTRDTPIIKAYVGVKDLATL